MSNEVVSYEVVTGDEVRLDRFLAARVCALPGRESTSRSHIKGWIERGCVSVDGVVTEKAGAALKVGSVVDVRLPETEPSHLAPLGAPLEVLFEDDSLIVINKQAGLSMHPGAGNRSNTLVNALVAHFGRGASSGVPEAFVQPSGGGVVRPGVVHRLDRDTTGVVVVAKTIHALNHLSRQFASRTVGRAYAALVFSTPRGLRPINTADSGTIDKPIGRHPTKRTSMAIVENGRRAVTHWKVLERMAYGVLVEARLETGRTHQIRVHFDSIGCPVIGDRTYGDFSGLPLPLQRAGERFGRQALHAFKLELDHPVTGERLRFTGALPGDFEGLLGAFRGGKG